MQCYQTVRALGNMIDIDTFINHESKLHSYEPVMIGSSQENTETKLVG
jgi:hypothetical protein